MFGKRVKLFTLVGFEVNIDVSWIIIAVLVTWSLAKGVFPQYREGLSSGTYWLMGMAGAAGLFASIIFHELCHSLVARRFGMQMKGITLFVFGGVAEMHDEPPSPKAEFLMAVAGPAASILAGAVFLALAALAASGGAPGEYTTVIMYVGIINLVLAGFNLLPAYPLDGGRVLRSILWSRKGNLRRATRISTRIGSAFGLLLVFAGVYFFVRGALIGGIWWFFIGIFLRNASRASMMRLEMAEALKGEPVSRFMRTDPVTVSPGLPIGQLVEDYIYRHHFKMYPVVESGTLRGCITIGDVKAVERADWDKRTVEEISSPCSAENSIDQGADAVEALRLMNKTGRSRMLVTDGGRLSGIIALKDMLRFIFLKMELEDEES